MIVVAALVALLVSAGLAIWYGLGTASSKNSLWTRLGGSVIAAIGVGALYFGIGLVRALANP